MINKEVIKAVNLKNPATWLATWFGYGFLKTAPGTWGTIGGIPFGMIIIFLGGFKAILASIIVIFAIGCWASSEFEKMSGEHDNSAIVIDEVVGIWIAMIPISITNSIDPLMLLMAFVFFRLFDIFKPWPVGLCDRKIPGALGVMVDDILAGIYAAIIIAGLYYYAGIG
jgi:phosphatidylglycerophosphatase A